MKLYRLYDLRAEEFSSPIPAKSDYHLIAITADSYHKAGEFFPDDTQAYYVGRYNDDTLDIVVPEVAANEEVIDFASRVNDEIRLINRRMMTPVSFDEDKK